MLRVEGLHKSFDGFAAVSGATLRVDEGEIVAVIGPNGAGKTTLFNLITGHLRPDQGSIQFEEQEVTGLAAHDICRRGIGRTFQIANIFPSLTVFENVQVSVLAQQRRSLDLFHRASALAVEETNAILDDTGLRGRSGRVAGALSHGDHRILEIAVALGSRPRLLVLDEPTAGMSPEETAAAMALVGRFSRERGLTILFCEHDMDVVFSVAQSVMMMRQGRTIVQGPPGAVRANREVQEAYLGTSEARG